jgi:hypothetical protein
LETAILFRPVGEAKFLLIRDSGWREFPPRLPEQPIFYPVLNQEYAEQIARDWNTRDGGSFHHRHFMGKVEAAEYSTYEALAERFFQEVHELWRIEDAQTKVTLRVGTTEDFFNRLRERAKKLDKGEKLPPRHHHHL